MPIRIIESFVWFSWRLEQKWVFPQCGGICNNVVFHIRRLDSFDRIWNRVPICERWTFHIAQRKSTISPNKILMQNHAYSIWNMSLFLLFYYFKHFFFLVIRSFNQRHRAKLAKHNYNNRCSAKAKFPICCWLVWLLACLF